MKVRMLPLGPLGNNVYIVVAETTKECVIIDPGWNAEVILKDVREHDLKVRAILATHGHIDHTNGIAPVKLQVAEAVVGIHKGDAAMLEPEHWRDACLRLAMTGVGVPDAPVADRWIEAGDSLDYGELHLEVRHTPGHSAGSVSYVGQGVVFSGDTLFMQSVGRTDTPGGSWQQLLNSIRTQLLILPDETVVLPGHGPKTRIGIERGYNPFLQEGAELLDPAGPPISQFR
ncbi:MAG: MBL fold metallo-hydrolase [Chloroflexi bacterium]|nr:MBL fold metallo-hydrolase [Chloroflexota bacterium]